MAISLQDVHCDCYYYYCRQRSRSVDTRTKSGREMYWSFRTWTGRRSGTTWLSGLLLLLTTTTMMTMTKRLRRCGDWLTSLWRRGTCSLGGPSIIISTTQAMISARCRLVSSTARSEERFDLSSCTFQSQFGRCSIFGFLTFFLF